MHKRKHFYLQMIPDYNVYVHAFTKKFDNGNENNINRLNFTQ